MNTYTAEINLYSISVKRSEVVRAPRREPCERQQLSNPVRFLCTLCTLTQTPDYNQRRPQQCREDCHKQKVLTLPTFSIYPEFDVKYMFNDCFTLSTLLSVLCGFSTENLLPWILVGIIRLMIENYGRNKTKKTAQEFLFQWVLEKKSWVSFRLWFFTQNWICFKKTRRTT